MKPFVVFVCVLSISAAAVLSDTSVPAQRRQDSYINALMDSHGKSNGDLDYYRKTKRKVL